MDSKTELNLGLKSGFNRRIKTIVFPKREDTVRSTFPHSPMATWMVNKFISDQIGIIPAIVLCDLISLNQHFNDENKMPKSSPFTLGEPDFERMADSIGISLEIYKAIINTFIEEKLLVKVTVEKEPSQVKFDRARRNLGLEYEWFQLNYELMDSLFFPGF